MQIADTQDGKKISPDTLNLINTALDREKPDFVVYSGDQIWGKRNFHGDKEKITKSLYTLTKPVQDRDIPFAVCFGNHDRQTGMSNEDQFEIYKTFKGFIGEDTPGIDGCANQAIEVEKDGETKYVIYLIDSHTNLNIGYDYDHVHQNQIDWYKKVRDGLEEKYGHVVPGVVIQHIPVPEVLDLLIESKKKTKGAVQGFRNHAGNWYVLNRERINETGFMLESPADPNENGGEYEAMAEKGDIRGIYFGHAHNNSFNGKVGNIDIGYTQGAGFHVYGPGLNRGVRVINLSEDGSLETHDIRYHELLGKKVKEKLHFIILQLMPTNLYDGIHRGLKILAVIVVLIIIILLLVYLL